MCVKYCPGSTFKAALRAIIIALRFLFLRFMTCSRIFSSIFGYLSSKLSKSCLLITNTSASSIIIAESDLNC